MPTDDSDIRTSLNGLEVVDLAHGLAGGIAAKLLGDLGASICRFEVAGDPSRAIHPAYDGWYVRASVRQVASFDDPAVGQALAGATVCIVGGEDQLDGRGRPDVETLLSAHPTLTVLVIDGYPSGSRPATELLAQARSGLVFEQFSERPFFVPFSPARYGAALHGVAGLLAALCGNQRGGHARLVRTSLYEGALTFGAQYWLSATQPGASFYRTVPKDPRQIIVRCLDGRYLHIVLGAAGAKGSLYRILGIDDPTVRPEDSGVPTGREEPRNFFGDIDLLSRHAEAFDSDTLATELAAAGVPASFVEAPGGCWTDQVMEQLGITNTDDRGATRIGLTLRGRVSAAAAPRLSALPADNAAAPLAGLRVLDFGMFTAGPYASVGLADLGADVIKVETLQGDPSAGIATSYATANRGKRMIVVDLKHPAGREIGERLVASAQVVYNNFRPGVSARLGLDPGAVLAADPNKVVLEATAFGRTGPGTQRPGFDMILQAYTGHEIRAGGVGNVPLWDRTILVDYTAGLLGHLAMLVGLWRRASGHGGVDLDISLVDAGLFLLSDLVREADGTMRGPALLNEARTGFHPASALYQTSDGWIAIDAVDEAMAARLGALVGAIGKGREIWGKAEQQTIERWAAAQTQADALTTLAAANVWAERCEPSGGEALRRGGAPADLLVTRPHPKFGEVTQLAAFFRIDGVRPVAALGVPTRGDQTRAILSSIGYGDEQVDRFYAEGVVA